MCSYVVVVAQMATHHELLYTRDPYILAGLFTWSVTSTTL